MDIEWFGDSSFLLRTATGTVAVDPPFGADSLPSSAFGADIVVLSQSDSIGSAMADPDAETEATGPGMAAREAGSGAFVVAGPGEYEIGGVFILGMAINEGSDAADDLPRTTGYLIDAEDLTICHLGGLSGMPAREHVEALGPVDVLLVPVGGARTLDPGHAVELVGQVEPSVIVPTHYASRVSDDQEDLAPAERFLSEMGVEAPEPLDVLSIAANRLPLEPKVVLLRPRS